MYNTALREEIEAYVNRHAPTIRLSMFACDLNIDCRAVIFKEDFPGQLKRATDPRSYYVPLPCRMVETNLFPSEKMLQYMELKPPMMKKAKPRDWISIIDAAIQKHFPEEYIP